MKILAIETSCDETAISILEAEGGTEGATYKVLGDALFSQASLHAEFGGVYPTLAKREHQKNLAPLTIRALSEANVLNQAPSEIDENCATTIREEEFRNDTLTFLKSYAKPDIDLIVVTKGPGLEPSLWTGITFAESLGKAWNIPVLGVDHMEGHIMSALTTHEDGMLVLKKTDMPVLGLLISGGHTEFMLMKDWFEYELVGKTKDDAIGEAFDKVARLLDMPYPGGPEISAHAGKARERDAKHDIVFPRPLMHDDTCDFSFSGLKTAVLYKLQKMPKLSQDDKEHIAQAFEDAAAEIVLIKTKRALERTQAKVLAVGGGVSANKEIRNGLKELIGKEFPNIRLELPEKGLTGDNAVMIGIAGHLRSVSGHTQQEPIKASGYQTLNS